jgi:two-component system phosphate regulon sensor histidine kinase PhoR
MRGRSNVDHDSTPRAPHPGPLPRGTEGEGVKNHMFRQLVRRFVLPQLLILGILSGAIIWVSAVQLGHATDNDSRFTRLLIPILSISFLVTLGAAIASTFAAYRFAVSHVEDISHLFASALPAAMPKKPRYAGIDPESTLYDVARSFSELMDIAAKDQAQLLTIIASMSDGLIATDHQQRILLTNDAARDQLLFRTTESKGRQLWEVIPIEAVLKAVTEVSLTGQQKTVSVGPVSGRYLDVTITRLPLRPAGFIIVAHDVTETMRYEELRKEFVANVSHELRTPLTVIKGYVETLQDGAIDDRARAIQYLGTVQRHTEGLTNLVDDLLSLSRLDSTSTIPSPRPVHLGRLASKVSESMTPVAHKKGHRLVVQIADGLHHIIGNAEYLERAMTNLVENAIKYTPKDGLIKLAIREDGGQTVVVEVSDNGMGISQEDLPRIFERFYRAERSRSRDAGGTGLGLSIVKHIVQAHGGAIEVTSTPGVGSSFRMRFPIAAEPSEQGADASDAAA